jgi:hypothetical protein
MTGCIRSNVVLDITAPLPTVWADTGCTMVTTSDSLSKDRFLVWRSFTFIFTQPLLNGHEE